MRWEVVVIGVLAGVVAGLVVGRWGRGGDGGGAGSRELDRRLAGISDGLDRRLADLDRRLYLGLDSVQDAQARAADTAAQVGSGWRWSPGSPSRSWSRPRVSAGWRTCCARPRPGARSGSCCWSSSWPRAAHGAYRTQHLFRSGARVDAVLVLGDAMVAIDSKFPGGVRPHEHDPRGRRGQGAAPAGLHPRRPPPRRRHRRQVHLPRRGHLRLRALLPAVGGGVLRVPA